MVWKPINNDNVGRVAFVGILGVIEKLKGTEGLNIDQSSMSASDCVCCVDQLNPPPIRDALSNVSC